MADECFGHDCMLWMFFWHSDTDALELPSQIGAWVSALGVDDYPGLRVDLRERSLGFAKTAVPPRDEAARCLHRRHVALLPAALGHHVMVEPVVPAREERELCREAVHPASP